MELPGSADSDAVHTTRLDMLRSLLPVTAMNVPSQTLRGQYEGYRDEVKVASSHTETFARVRLASNEPRWEGVSFTLQTGKAMAEKRTDVEITFSSPEHGEGSISFLHPARHWYQPAIHKRSSTRLFCRIAALHR
jgi:glucose-6-phosphate 1-dehydrogenase